MFSKKNGIKTTWLVSEIINTVHQLIGRQLKPLHIYKNRIIQKATTPFIRCAHSVQKDLLVAASRTTQMSGGFIYSTETQQKMSQQQWWWQRQSSNQSACSSATTKYHIYNVVVTLFSLHTNRSHTHPTCHLGKIKCWIYVKTNYQHHI